MSATVEQFRALYPAFSSTTTYTADEIGAWFVEAALRFTPSRFRGQWHQVVYLFTAHQLASFGSAAAPAESGAAVGALTSDRIGDLSQSYGQAIDPARVPAGLHEFLSTKYGLRLLGIILSRSASRGRVILTGTSVTGG